MIIRFKYHLSSDFFTMKLTPTERRLFKEAVIREYKNKYEIQNKGNPLLNHFAKSLRKAVPFNILIGLLACIGVVYFKGWEALVYLLLTGIIWTTIFSTVFTALFNPKKK